MSIERRFGDVRTFSEQLCETLATEDYGVQTMADVSPAKWHLAHTTWFFETFVVKPLRDDWRSPDPLYDVLFNSYYNAVGAQWTRHQRGLLSRPTVGEVYEYRAQVTEAVIALLGEGRADPGLVEIGINHEQQHQELLLTDIKHVFAFNPLQPVFREGAAAGPENGREPSWWSFDEGLVEIGVAGDGFAFDNESPRHRVFLESFEIADRLVTNGEWLEFMRDGGYSTASLWLSEGWALIQSDGWRAPLYWQERDGVWWMSTLGGPRPVDPHGAVTHVSLFEADAFATWSGARLPTEFEWESAARRAAAPSSGNFVESGRLHPGAAATDQFFGDAWEWTRSAYAPYPGYVAAPGALGEYNGKFMANQFVLRGGSCATSMSHIRATYRNFFPASSRWQFSGVRLCRSK